MTDEILSCDPMDTELVQKWVGCCFTEQRGKHCWTEQQVQSVENQSEEIRHPLFRCPLLMYVLCFSGSSCFPSCASAGQIHKRTIRNSENHSADVGGERRKFHNGHIHPWRWPEGGRMSHRRTEITSLRNFVSQCCGGHLVFCGLFQLYSIDSVERTGKQGQRERAIHAAKGHGLDSNRGWLLAMQSPGQHTELNQCPDIIFLTTKAKIKSMWVSCWRRSRLLQKNGGGYYTSKMFQEAEKAIREGMK